MRLRDCKTKRGKRKKSRETPKTPEKEANQTSKRGLGAKRRRKKPGGKLSRRAKILKKNRDGNEQEAREKGKRGNKGGRDAEGS